MHGMAKGRRHGGKTTGLVAVTCDRETYSAFVDFGARAIDMAVGLRANPNTYEYSKEELGALLETARAAICKGLGIEELEYPHHRPKMPCLLTVSIRLVVCCGRSKTE